MLFKKSTRQIVAGKRPRAHTADIGQNPAAGAELRSEPPETLCDAESYAEEIDNMDKLKFPRWCYWTAGAAFIISLVTIIILIIPKRSSVPESLALPEINADQAVVSVQADAALTALAEPGDIVQLYAADGTEVEELQYLQVYKPADEGRLLLLVDSRQASAIVGQDISTSVVLISHDNTERAIELLSLQKRINDPSITMELQPTAVLAPGDTLELSFHSVIDPVEATIPSIQWSSSDPEIAEVRDGVIHALTVGETTVTAKCGSQKVTCTVTVEVPLEEIRLDRNETVLAVGETLTLTARPEPQDTTRFDMVWTSSDPAIATVSADGTVTGIAPGTVVISVSSGSISAECTIRIGYRAEIVQLDRNAISLAIGQTYRLTPSIYPGTDIIDQMEFYSSNAAVATVLEDGTVTAVAAGTTIITFRCGNISAVCSVTVVP